MCLKCCNGMANSVDPDQTAFRSSLIWFYAVCHGLSIGMFQVYQYSQIYEVVDIQLAERVPEVESVRARALVVRFLEYLLYQLELGPLL